MSSVDLLIQKEQDEVGKRVTRALKAGGLPTEAETQEVFDELTDAHVLLESLSLRVEGVAASDLGEDLPPVTLEQLGALAILLADCEGKLHDLNELADRVRRQIPQLASIRGQQQMVARKA